MDIFMQNFSVGRRSFDDPFFEDGDKVCSFFKRTCVFDEDEEELCHEISKEFFCEVPGCRSTFESLIQFEIHYKALHQYVCSVCRKVLPSPHFLDLHIEENHDSFFSLQAERKPMYQCLVEDCKTKFCTAGERKDHCLKTHFFPPNFRWFILSETSGQKKGKSKSSKPKPRKNVDTEMTEQNLDSAPAETIMEEDTATGISNQQSQKKKPHKKHTHSAMNMDLDSGNSGSPVEIKEDDTPSKQLDSSNKSTKKTAPFKGFVPRNVNANRAFRQKSYFKGRDWHQNALSSNVAPSSLEGSNLSVDLKDSLPTLTWSKVK